jgi:hypothetical protein
MLLQTKRDHHRLNSGDLSLGYCETKTVNEAVPAAAGAISRQRRLHPPPAADRAARHAAPDQTGSPPFYPDIFSGSGWRRLHILLDAAERSRLPVVIVGGGPLEAEVRREAQQSWLMNEVPVPISQEISGLAKRAPSSNVMPNASELLDAAERSRLPVVIVGGGPLEAEVRREAQQRGLSLAGDQRPGEARAFQ